MFKNLALKGESFRGCFLAIIENAKRGKYLTIPGGPLLKELNEKNFEKEGIWYSCAAAPPPRRNLETDRKIQPDFERVEREPR